MGSGPGLACDLTLNSALSPELRARYQSQEAIRRAIAETRTIAMVGLSTRRQKASQFVATYLRSKGYRIVPVHLRAGFILGEKAYPSLGEIPERIDLVNVFRPAAECPDLARQAAGIGARVFWLQLGIVNEQAGAIAAEAGLGVVMDRCLKMEHARYDGTMHFMGMNTGIISARRPRPSTFRRSG